MNTIVILDSDTEIKRMICEHGIHEKRPEPPNDVSFFQIKENDMTWLVVHWWKPGDSGYAAYGLPQSASREGVKEAATLILGTLETAAKGQGLDMWEAVRCVPIVTAPTRN